jgi:hypothetical protein
LVALLGIGLENAISAIRKFVPLAHIVAVIVVITIAVVTFFSECGLANAVAAGRLHLGRAIFLRAVQTFVLTDACATITFTNISVVTLFTNVENTVAAVRVLKNLTRHAAMYVWLSVLVPFIALFTILANAIATELIAERGCSGWTSDDGRRIRNGW